MTIKLTQKQENFCQAVITEANHSDAYRKAYNTKSMSGPAINREAKRLMDNPKITTRIELLQAAHRERHNVTVDSITEEYDENRELARDLEKPEAMNAATTGKAKLHGLITDNKNIKVDANMNMTTVVEFVDAPPPTE